MKKQSKVTISKNVLTAIAAAFTLSAFASTGDGGILERKPSIPSKPISVVNSQKALPQDVFQTAVKEARRHSRLPLEANAAKAPITLTLVEQDNANTITLFPEQYAATINVKAIGVGCQAQTTLVERVEKEIIRAGYYLLGSGYGQKGCITSTIRTMKELDELDMDFITAESQLHIRGAQKNGVKLVQWATYRMACRQGWAPQPDTAERKAIWDEIHATPTNPIIIKPETAKQN